MIYRGYFTNINGERYKVDFTTLLEGKDKDILLSTEPVVINWVGDNTPFKPIKQSSCTISLYIYEYMYDLFTAKNDEVTAVVYKLVDDEWNVFWQGFVTHNVYNQDILLNEGVGTVLEVECIDILSTLKNRKYKKVDASLASLYDILKDLTTKSKLHFDNLYYQRSLIVDEDTEEWPVMVMYNQNNFFNEEGEPWPIYEVIENICKLFGVTMYTSGKDIFIYDVTTIANDYNSIDFATDLTDKELQLYSDVDTDNYVKSPRQQVSIQEKYNKVTIYSSQYIKENFIVSPDDKEDLYSTSSLLHYYKHKDVHYHWNCLKSHNWKSFYYDKSFVETDPHLGHYWEYYGCTPTKGFTHKEGTKPSKDFEKYLFFKNTFETLPLPDFTSTGFIGGDNDGYKNRDDDNCVANDEMWDLSHNPVVYVYEGQDHHVFGDGFIQLKSEVFFQTGANIPMYYESGENKGCKVGTPKWYEVENKFNNKKYKVEEVQPELLMNLRIGNKQWNGSSWVEEDKDKFFTIRFGNKGDEVWNNWLPSVHYGYITVEGQIPETVSIPCSHIDMVNGRITIKLCTPRPMRFAKHDHFYTFMKGFELTFLDNLYKSTVGEEKELENDNTDITWSIDIDEDYISEFSDVELKVSSKTTHLYSMSDALFMRRNLGLCYLGKIQKYGAWKGHYAEEYLLDSMYNHHSQTKKQIAMDLKCFVLPNNSVNTDYIIDEIEYSLCNDESRIKIIEL